MLRYMIGHHAHHTMFCLGGIEVKILQRGDWENLLSRAFGAKKKIVVHNYTLGDIILLFLTNWIKDKS